MITYGDGVSDVDIAAVAGFHKKNRCLATLTAVRPLGRYGSLDIAKDDKVSLFLEKPRGDHFSINAGFFVLEPQVFSYIDGDETVWEAGPLERLAQERQLCAYRHAGFWKGTDTLRDKNELERLWQAGQAPWKTWP